MAAKTVDAYIEGAAAPVQEILREARQLILELLPDGEEYMKWGVPGFGLSGGDQLLYLYGGKDHVNLGFLLGSRLDDPQGLLQGAGTKDSRHVHLASPQDVANAAVTKLITDSAVMDDERRSS